MTFNPRYLTHNSHITSGGQGNSTGVSNPLHSLKEREAATYSYAVCGDTPVAKAGNTLSSCAETDTYELMKPSGSVKRQFVTTDNVCYTNHGHY